MVAEYILLKTDDDALFFTNRGVNLKFVQA